MRKRTIALLLVAAMLLALAACGNSGGGATENSTPAVTGMPEPVSMPGAEPMSGTMPSDEYERAVWYGLAESAGDPDRDVTQGEFYAMLTDMVELYKPECLDAWQNTSYAKDSDDTPVFRFHAAIQLLYAAETIDHVVLSYGQNPTFDSSTARWDIYWNIDWGKTDGWSEETFSEPSPAMKKAVGSDAEYNHCNGGVDFAASCLSCVTGRTLLDMDNTLYMRNMDHLTYREAAVAVLRLYESVPENARVTVDFEAGAEWETGFLRDAEARKQELLSGSEPLPCSGTAYYISNSGDDNSNGRSPETPWATLEKLNTSKFQTGDVVYLERGGIWRGYINCPDGVSLSAYGEGDKPTIYGSTENGAGGEKWSLYYKDGSEKKIWKYNNMLTGCGGIMLGDTDTIALRVYSWLENGSLYFTEDRTRPFDIAEALTRDLTFCCDQSTGILTTLYLRCDEGNPGDLYHDIEFFNEPVEREERGESHIIQLGSNCVLDNLCIKYFSDTAIYMVCENGTVQNCDISYGGGGSAGQDGDDLWADGQGIFFLGTGGTIQNNYIHDIKGSGVNMEVCLSYEETIRQIPYSGNTVRHNLLERLGKCASIYVNNAYEELRDEDTFDGLEIADNWILYSGTSWSEDLSNTALDEPKSISFGGGISSYSAGTVIIRDNIFFRAACYLFDTHMQERDRLPIITGNVFAQPFGDILAMWYGDCFVPEETEHPYIWGWRQQVNAWGQQATEQRVQEYYGDTNQVVILDR